MSNDVLVAALIDAMEQLLDDMGVSGTCVCLASKARARIAFEPFLDWVPAERFMPLADAQRIIQESAQ